MNLTHTNFSVCRHALRMPLAERGSVVAIGNFDGVHKGHQTLLKIAYAKAKKLNLPLIVLTFYPHPKAVFMPEVAPLKLTSFAQRCRLLKACGVAGVYVIRFSKTYAKTSAETFLEETLLYVLHAKHVVVGEGFRFGKGRLGDTEFLQKWGEARGCSLTVVPPYCCEEGKAISSTRIRAHIAAGNMPAAEALLGKE